ncbi:MAG: group II intron maturase-specific domain-containing protein [Wolbachia sp.]
MQKKKYGNISHRSAQKTISIITYADDFVILQENEEIVLKTKVIVEEWLKTTGLELKPSKTRVLHTLKPINGEKPGFDFLGFSIRQYPVKRNKRSYKLLIKPSRESIKQHTKIVKHKLKRMLAAPQEAVIKELNPIIRGWCQYYTSAVSSKIFNSLDDIMFKKLWKWAVFRHQNKGRFWIKKKYFKKYNNNNWRFMSSDGTYLIKHKDHAIKRHVKVLGTKSPYDGDWIYGKSS